MALEGAAASYTQVMHAKTPIQVEEYPLDRHLFRDQVSRLLRRLRQHDLYLEIASEHFHRLFTKPAMPRADADSLPVGGMGR